MHRYGRPCELQIGVAKNSGFRAHAWVTTGDKIVHGETDDHFTPLEKPLSR
jgi:Transglutaminase-like superfamily